MYAKLIDGNLEFAPQNKGSIINYNANVELMVADGYKLFVKAPRPVTNRKYHIEYTETSDKIKEVIKYDETQEEAEERERQQEKNRINSLSMTRSDFFDSTIKAWGADSEDLLPIVENILGTLPISSMDKKIAINNYNNALNFYRKHALFSLLSGIPITIGEITINISEEQWDRFFDKMDKKDPDAYKELLPDLAN